MTNRSLCSFRNTICKRSFLRHIGTISTTDLRAATSQPRRRRLHSSLLQTPPVSSIMPTSCIPQINGKILLHMSVRPPPWKRTSPIIICPYFTLVSSNSFYDIVQRATHDLDNTFYIYRPRYLLTNEGYCRNNSIFPRLNREEAMTDSLRGNEPGIRPVPCFF